MGNGKRAPANAGAIDIRGDLHVKIAYLFVTSGHNASYKLGKMILPQLEENRHGVDVVGMFFFDDNTYVLRQGDPIGERLAKVAAEKGMLLMMCDQCALADRRPDGRPFPAGPAFQQQLPAQTGD